MIDFLVYMTAKKGAPKRPKSPKPLSPAKATHQLREYGASLDLDLYWTDHATEQMDDRDLLMSDVLHVLKYGFVHNNGVSTSQPGHFKYEMECTTPNSGNRTVRIVFIPSQSCAVKIITVMWAD